MILPTSASQQMKMSGARGNLGQHLLCARQVAGYKFAQRNQSSSTWIQTVTSTVQHAFGNKATSMATAAFDAAALEFQEC